MDIEIGIQIVLDALESLGLTIPAWIILVLAALVLLNWLGVLGKISQLAVWATKALFRLFYNRDDREFVGIRNRFVKHLIYEVERLNRDADWNDFHYTALEAEVEVDPALDPFCRDSNRVFVWLHSIRSLFRGMLQLSPAGRIEGDLIHAIMRSRSRAFLIIGDPGSGKTVSLRHLFLRMAEECAISKNKSAIVPLYLNLKQLDIPPDNVSADVIHNWVVEQLRLGQDRTIHDFLDINFEFMLRRGEFFFLFDSFDEIPAVMDTREEEDVIRQYAKALDDFLHAPHRCRGLVSSRPHRAPKVFIGQRMTIRPLSYARVKRALYRYMVQNRALAQQVWHELVQRRDDLLLVIRTPFYLALLARYAKEREQLPERHYELFEHFVQSRAKADEQRLRAFGLTPTELVEQASVLAFNMTQTPHIGLEASVYQVQTILAHWQGERVQSLLDALCYSKLGRMARGESGRSQVFNFVHRRFQEYFSARYLRYNPHIAPVEDLVADNRWREVLVLLCEVLPSHQLSAILDTSRSALSSGIQADPGTSEHRKAIEALRFLRDGFRSRLEDLPNDICVLCSEFIRRQLLKGNLLDQKRALEGINLADEQSAPALLETALTSDSAWLQETALRSCRVLSFPPREIAGAIRRRLYQRYKIVDLHRDFFFYSVLFSSPPSFVPLLQYTRLLGIGTLIQVGVYVLFSLFYIMANNLMPLALFVALVLLSGLPSWSLPEPSMQWLSKLPILSRIQESFNFIRSRRASGRFFQQFLKKQMKEVRSIWLVLPLALWAALLFGRLKTSPTTMITTLAQMRSVEFWGSILKSFAKSSTSVSLKEAVSNLSLLAYSLPIPMILVLLHVLMFYFVNHYPTHFADWILLPFRFVAKVIEYLFKIDRYSLMVILTGFGIFGWYMFSTTVFARSGYSLKTLYTTYHFVVATLIVLGLCPYLGLLAIPVLGLQYVWYISSSIWQVIRDQGALRLLSIRASARPASALEAVRMLHTFKSDIGKAQYVRALLNWLPIGTDWDTLIGEAGKHSGAVRDGLYQLTEVWQDSQQRTGGREVQ